MSELIVRTLACADENVQAEFLNQFAAMLRTVCNQGHGWNTQTCYIGKHLTEATREVLETLAEYQKLHVEESVKTRQRYDNLRAEIRALELRREELVENELV